MIKIFVYQGMWTRNGDGAKGDKRAMVVMMMRIIVGKGNIFKGRLAGMQGRNGRERQTTTNNGFWILYRVYQKKRVLPTKQDN